MAAPWRRRGGDSKVLIYTATLCHPRYSLLKRLLAMTCWLRWLNTDDLLLIRRQNARKSDWLSEELKEAACLHCRDEIRSLLSSLLERTDEVVAAL